MIDFTHLMHEGMPVYPNTLSPTFEVGNTIEEDGFAELNMSMCTHTGTHIDAPSHILPATRSLDQFPLAKFMGKALVIDCSTQNAIHRELLEQHKAQLEAVDFILFYTGWQHKWGTAEYFAGHPTPTPEATEYLCQFNLKAIGFDAISVDAVNDASLPNHHVLLAREILIIENLTNLDQVAGQVIQFYCMPLHIKAADGSPVRAWGAIDNS